MKIFKFPEPRDMDLEGGCDGIVHRILKALFAAPVPHSGFDGDVAKEVSLRVVTFVESPLPDSQSVLSDAMINSTSPS